MPIKKCYPMIKRCAWQLAELVAIVGAKSSLFTSERESGIADWHFWAVFEKALE
jgi:hypothetical protein